MQWASERIFVPPKFVLVGRKTALMTLDNDIRSIKKLAAFLRFLSGREYLTKSITEAQVSLFISIPLVLSLPPAIRTLIIESSAGVQGLGIYAWKQLLNTLNLSSWDRHWFIKGDAATKSS